MQKKLTVGLTGGIGCGKTTVANLFAKHGAEIIDADIITRELVAPTSPLLKIIQDKFGAAVINEQGELDRQIMRLHIFSHPEDKTWLEKLLHPKVREVMQHRINQSTAPYIILVIPLLIENLPNPLVQRILVVDCDETAQLNRAVTRDQNKTDLIKQIIAQQVNRPTRLTHADDIIYNDKNIEHLVTQVDQLHQFYLSLSQAT